MFKLFNSALRHHLRGVDLVWEDSRVLESSLEEVVWRRPSSWPSAHQPQQAPEGDEAAVSSPRGAGAELHATHRWVLGTGVQQGSVLGLTLFIRTNMDQFVP